MEYKAGSGRHHDTGVLINFCSLKSPEAAFYFTENNVGVDQSRELAY